MHIFLLTTYNFGVSKKFFSKLGISQALEDDDNIYIVKNISKLAGEGAISRINSGLKDDIMQYDNYEWLIISKINNKD